MPTSQAITAIGLPPWPGIAMMIFRGIAQQVTAVRRFVESEIRDHPALDNAVLVASELAANAIAHSVSGADRGKFCVHVAVTSPGRLCIAVSPLAAGNMRQLCAVMSAPGEPVNRTEGILRVKIARLITGSPGKMEV